MRAVVPVLAAVGCLLLSGCSPVVDVEFHNGTGEPIVVTNVAQPTFHASIPAGGSAPVEVLVLRSGYPEEFTIAAGGRVWIYRHHTIFLGSVGREYLAAWPFRVQATSRERRFAWSDLLAFIFWRSRRSAIKFSHPPG